VSTLNFGKAQHERTAASNTDGYSISTSGLSIAHPRWAYRTGLPVVSNQVIERKPNGQFAKGSSGNLGGNAQRTRHMFSKAFVEALLEDFRDWGAEAIVRVRTETPTTYLRVCAMLIPKELKLEHSQGIKALSDEQVEEAIQAIRTMLAARASEGAKVIEGTAEPAALPAFEARSIGDGLEPKRQRSGTLHEQCVPGFGHAKDKGR
jgi:hypothetical protein